MLNTSSQASLEKLSQLIEDSKTKAPISKRIDFISHSLIGKSYQAFPLIGSETVAEALVVSSESFDCVTYVETTLALACSDSPKQFLEHLQNIRYADSQISWHSRNHYMTSWIDENVKKGYLELPAISATNTIIINKVLDCLPGLEKKCASIHLLACSTEELDKVDKIYQDGDIIFFGSSRDNLDIFHLGFLFRGSNKQIQLRHASRSEQLVLQEDLSTFLTRANGCSGVILARPKLPKTNSRNQKS